jgi:hypothetical protein
MRPKSPFPKPPWVMSFISDQGVGIVTLLSSRYLDSISLLYSCPMFLSYPAFNAPSIINLIES